MGSPGGRYSIGRCWGRGEGGIPSNIPPLPVPIASTIYKHNVKHMLVTLSHDRAYGGYTALKISFPSPSTALNNSFYRFISV